MLQRDAVQLYELPEAGRLLFEDPKSLARAARLGRIPSARADGKLGLPVPWVDAESGDGATDPEALRLYWLGRLAPASPQARRCARERARLPLDDVGLLAPSEAARRVFATPAALRRLDGEGTLPSLRVEGEVRYDALLTDLVAREGDGPEVDEAIEARRAEVLAWARFEYASAPETPAPAFDAVREATPRADGDEPEAYEIPDGLLSGIEALPSQLIEAEGFETRDEE